MKGLVVVVLLFATGIHAADVQRLDGGWTSVSIFHESPLEAKLGIFEDINNPHSVGHGLVE